MNQSIRHRRCQLALTCLATLAALVAVIFNTGCATGSGRAASGKPSCCVDELTIPTPLSDKSLYQLDSSWTNDKSAALQLVSLRGRPQIVTMFFAKCEYACPILVHDMKRIEAALPENVRTNVGFVLVSFDSERDTPAALASYRKIHDLPPNWTLLRGAPDDVLELAALLGVKYKKDARGQFAHSNVITILDTNGDIVRQFFGLNQDVTTAAGLIERSLATATEQNTNPKSEQAQPASEHQTVN
jgi:protein SCO1/2